MIDNKLPIGEAELQTAQKTLREYQAGKENLDAKIIANEDWWKLQHWKQTKKNQNKKQMKASAWLFNSIAGKHADAMDNYPEATCLPQEPGDDKVAKALTSILPVVFEKCHFKRTYRSNWWDKLKNGVSIYMPAWDKDLNNGVGDISIKEIDILSMAWEPGIEDIQDSRNVFVMALRDNDLLKQEYPELVDKLSGGPIDKKEYHYDDTVDTSNKSIVVDWYYKVRKNNRDILHYVQYCGDTILFATENTEGYENGLYNHGLYPFIFDCLYPEKGTPVGFGYIDVMRDAQEEIDELGNAIIENAKEAAKRRYLVKDNCGINVEQFNNPDERIVNCSGSPSDDNFRALEVPALSGTYVNILTLKTDELKETSGNRDFNQGSTSSGVTAASAITALIESGSKLSRDTIDESYDVFTEICIMTIELIRQFYDTKRTFRILGENGQDTFVDFDNTGMQAKRFQIADQTFVSKEPIYDIKVKAHKKSPYAVISQNELALQFYKMGAFNPQYATQVLPCIDMMEFEGKDKVKQIVQNNGTIYNQLQQTTQLLVMAAQALADKGDTRVLQALQQMNGEPVKTPNIEIEGESAAEKTAESVRKATEVK